MALVDWILDWMYGSEMKLPEDPYILMEETMLYDEFDCELDNHQWNDWKIIAEGHLVDEEEAIIGRYLDQQRTCCQCGFSVLDTQKSFL